MILNEVLEDKSPGGQASNSLETHVSQSVQRSRPHEGPQREASVGLQRTCLREVPVPSSVSVGSAVGRHLRNQSLWVNNSVRQALSCPRPGCTALRGLLTYTPPLSLITPGSVGTSHLGDFPRSSSVSYHIYCTSYHFSLSSSITR